MKYVSLHNHTEYSLLDSPTAPKAYAAKAAEMEMPALAITDHGSLSGVVKFVGECRLLDIKPILGCEFYVREGLLQDKERHHIIALARNKEGWNQLLTLNKFANQVGYYYRPRITMDVLLENCSNLIVTSACIASPFMDFHKKNDIPGAVYLAKRINEATGGNFYFELIFNGLDIQKDFNTFILAVARCSDIPFIITNDTHFISKSDAVLRSILYAIQYKKTIAETDINDVIEDIYFKTPDQIWETATEQGFSIDRKQFEEGMERTIEVAEKVGTYDITLGRYAIPSFCATQEEADQMVERLCYEKLIDLKPAKGFTLQDYKDRLDREIGVISFKNFSNYFLIMRDIIQFCQRQEIFYGVGRGSVVGSLVAYLLEITRLDPLEYDLMFERFLSRSRKEPPDIDMDFDSNRRDEVEQYIKEKYGAGNVGHVFTSGTFGTRGIVRDFGRVFVLDPGQIDAFTKEMQDDKSVVEEAQKYMNSHADTPAAHFIQDNWDLWRMAEKLRGRLRHYGLHASGVVIDDNGLQSIPVLRVKDQIVCALQEGADEREISEMGLIKFDILGLTACTIINNIVKMVRQTTGEDITKRLNSFDFQRFVYSDIMHRFNEGDTAGVFQFCSPGIRKFMQKVGVSKFDDLVVINALYRPANLVSGEAEEYIERKRGKEYAYIDDRLKPILGKTFGCIVYQEQILQLLNVMGGLSLEEADEIRSLFKKYYQLGITAANNVTQKKMHDFEVRVKEKWVERGLSTEKSERLFQLINHYTKYAFNKSHATAYAYIAFQMMWLKENYPAEFYTAAMNAEIDDEEKVRELRHNAMRCTRKGVTIRVLPPQLNKSQILYSIEKSDRGRKVYHIREGLASINGVGARAAEETVNVYPVTDYEDFVNRVNRRVVNKRVLEIYRNKFVFDGIKGVPKE